MTDAVHADVLERLNFAKMLAFDAGKLVMKYYGNLSSYDHKGKVDLVSEADQASEALITDALSSRFAGDAILGEEKGVSEGENSFRWLVDPLDGTTNFVHAHPMFAVSFGLELHQRTVAGVVYIPSSRELFYASRGGGAFGPGGAIKVSSTTSLGASLVATGLPYNRREIVDVLLEDWRRSILNTQGTRRMGAAAVDLVYLACGRYDGFWERGLKPWDTSAGALIIEEAGGVVTDFAGEQFSPYGDLIAASNGLIHDELLKTLFEDRT